MKKSYLLLTIIAIGTSIIIAGTLLYIVVEIINMINL